MARRDQEFILVSICGSGEFESREYWDGQTFSSSNQPILMSKNEAENARFETERGATIEKAWWL